MMYEYIYYLGNVACWTKMLDESEARAIRTNLLKSNSKYEIVGFFDY